MIDYTELIDRLNKYSAEHEAHGGITAEAADAIEELLAKVPKWISVEERLPNDDSVVIVAIHDVSGDTPFDFASFGWCLNGVGDDYWWIVDNDICPYVTHWMPLPEPPKEVAP